MIKKIKNIANRPIPVSGNKDLIPNPGQIVEAVMNTGLLNQIQNKFFEIVDDVFEFEVPNEKLDEALKNIDEEQEDFYEKEANEDMQKPLKKNSRKFKKNKKSSFNYEGED